ncbi:major pollen allergen Ole e 10-like isoform X2 [Actinidia eriantha]|uniref:major pollen allergen Ole e 10-like isoform X2 n=1 Tax=Actinidia eriantha TaxID=165200 RepID=UPI00258DD101|nr:major pollen allergen Ole e 10-like isoform X2 [Actinidia eriantha]
MARANLSFGFLCFLLYIVVCTSTRDSTIWAGQKRGVVRIWCVANPSAGAVKLQNFIDNYCNVAPLDCKLIRPGGTCYEPNTVQEHASVLLNLAYKADKKLRPCPLDVGQITLKDPSHGSCIYP